MVLLSLKSHYVLALAFLYQLRCTEVRIFSAPWTSIQRYAADNRTLNNLGPGYKLHGDAYLLSAGIRDPSFECTRSIYI